MKKLLALLAFVCISGVQANSQNIEGQIVASQFGQYIVPGQTTGSFQFTPDSCQVSGGGKNFSAFTTNVPIKIVDGNPLHTEIATPSSVFISVCTLNVSTTYTHTPPYYLTSGTGGLQEAITNGPVKGGGPNTVILNADWYAQVAPGVPATVIATVAGNTSTGLVDVTTTPYTWYHWNGTQYVVITIGGSSVTSVFGRTGAVTATAGDYTCLLVTNCGAATGWTTTLNATQSNVATTITLASVTGIPTAGTFYIDSEYETYTGVNVGLNQLTGITRGAYTTTPASHTFGNVYSVDIPFGPPTQLPTGGIFGIANIGAGFSQFIATNCGTPQTHQDAGAITVFTANCGGSETYIDSAGRIHQAALGTIANFMSPIYIGNYAVDTVSNLGQPIPILNTTNVAQTNGPNQFGSPMGFTSGIYGPVQSKAVPNIPAPTLSGSGGGSCSITYEITGVDSDGATIPGATATVGSLIFPGVGIVLIQAPAVAGVVTYNVYRTVVSGCGGMTIGKFTAAQTTQYPFFTDNGGTGDGTAPPGSNTSVAKTCTNGELYCTLAGSGTTPPISCGATANNGSPTYGWEYHNVSATTSPYVYHCVSGASSWSTAY